MTFFEKSLNTLELNTVLKLLADEAVIDTAKEICLNLRPSTDAIEVSRQLDETEAAYNMMTLRGSPGMSSVKDVRASLSRAELGGSLNTRELLDICSLLRCSRLVKSYVSADDNLGRTCIDHLFNALRTDKYLEEKISTCISGEDEISDSASNELADIRRKMRAASARAREALSKIISSPSFSKALQENIITTRSDRYVVPVKAEFKNQIPGLVHDISSSGATLFVEPMGAVKANNELRELASKEKAEIERILAELSADCAEHKDNIESDYILLTRIDVIFAKAKLSYKMEGSKADISTRKIVLRKARHPLLNKRTAVPIDIEMGENFDTLIITGPNTGGKTVTLKTIGLLSAMNQCGLFVPASYGTELPVFTQILADIGDEQSIEQSLSTFSAHMSNIVSILENCNDSSLVLFDELGAGTDPAEGAALAVAIIEKVRSSHSLVAATTHYTELKVYATNEEGVLNASCEFDIDTLKPTYHLLLGVPGKSNAFAISKRLGLDDSIIENAKQYVGTNNAKFESTIEKLEKTRLLLEKDRDEIQVKLREAQENARKASLLKAEHEVRLEKAEVKAKREAESILDEARKTAESVFAELDEMKKHINEEDEVSRINEARNQLRRKLNLAEEKVTSKAPESDDRVSSRPVKVGDVVEIKNMGIKAEVISISDDRTLNLQAGIMNITAKEDEVYLLDGFSDIKKKNIKSTSKVTARLTSCPAEIDLRGMESLEAVSVAERYIDDAVMAKMHTVSIIHGKGTGALRKAIQDMLKKNKCVKSFRLGNFGEGESGVTIVELK